MVVRNGKGHVSRRVGIDDQALERVDRWRERRRRLGVPRDAPLFCTLKGEQLDQAYVRRTRRLAAKLTRRPGPGERPQDVAVAVDRRVHPHALRHTLAHELYAKDSASRTSNSSWAVMWVIGDHLTPAGLT